MSEVQQFDLFGKPVYNPKRSMSDFFIVPPFSVLNTQNIKWQRRKKKWDNLIKDKGETRLDTKLYGGGIGERDDPTSNRIKSLGVVSILDAAMAEIIIKWFAQPGFKAFDPFAGDSVFGYVSSHMGLTFTGIELRHEQCDLNNKRIQDAGFFKSTYICDTSENMDKYIPDLSQDFIFSCPPYADLEVYSDNPFDLSTMSHEKFFEVYRRILMNTYRKLKNNRFAVIITSDVRDKKGFYIRLDNKTNDFMEEAGYKLYNELIIINSVGSLPLRAARPMSISRKTGRMHQKVLVYYKGDPAMIKKEFQPLSTSNEFYNKNEEE